MIVLAIDKEHDPALLRDLQFRTVYHLALSKATNVLQHQQPEGRVQFDDPIFSIDHINDVR